MAKGTKIEWADDTVNAEMGCDGCELWDPKNQVRICYAGLQTERMLSKGPLKGWPSRGVSVNATLPTPNLSLWGCVRGP